MEITFDKERALQCFQKQNEIPRDEIEILYSNDYWDGPLNGLCKWNSEEYYFLWTGEMSKEDEIIRRFFIIKLTLTQLQKEKNNHALFEKAKEENTLQEFYKAEKENVILDIAQMVGWVDYTSK